MPRTSKKGSKDILPKAFSASLTVDSKVSEVEGDTLLECLDKLTPPFDLVRYKGKLTAKHDNKTASMILYPFQIRRFKVNKLFRKILDKRLTVSFR